MLGLLAFAFKLIFSAVLGGIFGYVSRDGDTVNNDILFQKLEVYGIRSIPLNWFKSYLDSRIQYVEYNGVNSDNKNITCGVLS